MDNAIKYGLWRKNDNPDEATQSIMSYNKDTYTLLYKGHDRRNLSASAVADWIAKDIRKKSTGLTINDGDLLTIERVNSDGKVEAYRATHGVLVVLEDLVIAHGVEDFSDKVSILDGLEHDKEKSNQMEKTRQAVRDREKALKKKKKKNKDKEDCL